MINSEVRHHFWVTRKVVERKLGSKEDEFVVSSDAELDAKIELFKTISYSCSKLYKIVDQYQERLCILAQEENALGKFLKEIGKDNNSSGKIIMCTGKAISHCGQQRMTMRPPLLRLLHEVETFRSRAIEDTRSTIICMERERTEYRASLCWMKSVSSQLDPDTGKGLGKFRKAQTQVRITKAKFDKFSLDCLQKIDLLAAARCNMFSHTLVAYTAALLQFVIKSSETFKATGQTLSATASTQYNFCILKDLTESLREKSINIGKAIISTEPNQILLLQDEHSEDNYSIHHKSHDIKRFKKHQTDNDYLIELSSNDSKDVQETTNELSNLFQLETNSHSIFSKEFNEFSLSNFHLSYFMSSQLALKKFSITNNDMAQGKSNFTETISRNNWNTASTKKKDAVQDICNRSIAYKHSDSEIKNLEQCDNPKTACTKTNVLSWFDMFSELDPLLNPNTLCGENEDRKEYNQAA